ncbi:MAG: UDP-N-acetylglucosamine 4,6-dehydratase family protein, partial [Kiritimatiellia bacterium]
LSVLISGAGGSIGSELVRQVARIGPDRIVLFERYENALYNIDREIREKMPGVNVVPVVGDICDAARVENVFQHYRPDLVIHAAAHKHVPMMEINPGEAVRNNVIGTRILGDAAVKYGVHRFLLISTDKAVNPICVMGITKRMAEMVIQVLNRNQGKTLFSAVRFGNVLGSSGSVVPLFREQISRGGPVTVTHPDMQRYFMTVEEAVHLVLLTITQSSGGEIYVLDMGKPIRIVEMAEEMIRLSGLLPYEDVPIIFTGVRPGEKLSEELDVCEDSVLKTPLARIYLSNIVRADPGDVQEMMGSCERICAMKDDYVRLRSAVTDLYSMIVSRSDNRVDKQ